MSKFYQEKTQILGKTDPQINFFNSYIEEYFLPKGHELFKIKKKVDFSFLEEETEDLYAKVTCSRGHRSIDYNLRSGTINEAGQNMMNLDIIFKSLKIGLFKAHQILYTNQGPINEKKTQY